MYSNYSQQTATFVTNQDPNQAKTADREAILLEANSLNTLRLELAENGPNVMCEFSPRG